MEHNDAVNHILIELSKRGYFVYRREVGLFFDMRGNKRKIGIKGEADIQGIAPGGRAVAVEVKTGKAVRRKEQKRWAERFIQIGGLYELARINSLEDVKKVLTNCQ